VVLAIDVSGSMQGDRLATSAATVGAMVQEMHQDRLSVIAFWRDALVLTKLGQRILIPSLVETILRIPVRGLTNIHFGLDVARHELARIWSREPRVILLSDCLHSAGPDPRLLAPAVPRLDVILDTSGEHDRELAADLAWLGRGKLACVRAYEDVPPAIADLFT
jgi:Mg-chelatase subunit ChlD